MALDLSEQMGEMKWKRSTMKYVFLSGLAYIAGAQRLYFANWWPGPAAIVGMIDADEAAAIAPPRLLKLGDMITSRRRRGVQGHFRTWNDAPVAMATLYLNADPPCCNIIIFSRGSSFSSCCPGELVNIRQIGSFPIGLCNLSAGF